MGNENVMVDGFGRKVDEDLYWHNTGLSSASIARIKEYHRTHPVQADGTRLKDEATFVVDLNEPEPEWESHTQKVKAMLKAKGYPRLQVRQDIDDVCLKEGIEQSSNKTRAENYRRWYGEGR